MKITDTIKYVGVNDHQVDLFEGQYAVPNGMAYNSYVILDDKVAVMDTVDANFKHEWLDNLEQALGGRKPDYLIVQHMEPDHAANVANFLEVYPGTTVVANAKTFVMIKNFFGLDLEGQKLEVENGSTLSLGNHNLTFVFAPMVHWPEVMVTYDSTDKVLFSADGFGKFGALDVEENWDDEARRYFIGIVGKYGAQVQRLLKVAATLDIQIICPLHGPVLTENLGHYISLYDTWSSYTPEEEGIVVAYTSVYGHTKEAVNQFVEKLKSKGCPKVVVYDLARDDMSQALSMFADYICWSVAVSRTSSIIITGVILVECLDSIVSFFVKGMLLQKIKHIAINIAGLLTLVIPLESIYLGMNYSTTPFYIALDSLFSSRFYLMHTAFKNNGITLLGQYIKVIPWTSNVIAEETNVVDNLYGYILINFGAIFFTVVILTLVISYIYASKKDERKICLCILFFIIAGFCENKMLYIGTNIFTLYIAVALYQSSMKIRKSVLDD